MKPEKLEKLAVTMGLSYSADDNFKDMKGKGIRVFNGCNGQRFLIDSNWSDDKIFETLGESLILFGKRKKCMEVRDILSINGD
jgi:hypothetical protein